MKKILIATDGSESALEALEFGLELAEEQDATAFLVHVAPAVEVVPYANFAAPAPRVPHELDDDDRVPLTEAAEIAALKGVDAKTELLVGNPADEIVAFGDTIDADLIVVGSAWPRRDRERAAWQRVAGRAPREPAAGARRPRRARRGRGGGDLMRDRLATDELCAGDVMSRQFLSVAPEDTLGELAERLAEADVGSALVVEYGRAYRNPDLARRPSSGRRPGPSKRGSRPRLDERVARHGPTRVARRRGRAADVGRRLSSPADRRRRAPGRGRRPARGRRRASAWIARMVRTQ